MRIDNHEIADGPMKTAIMGFEAEELLAIMWAIELAGEVDPGDHAESAWEVHQRLQEAWRELRQYTAKIK